jgi:hypothetical protein
MKISFGLFVGHVHVSRTSAFTKRRVQNALWRNQPKTASNSFQLLPTASENSINSNFLEKLTENSQSQSGFFFKLKKLFCPQNKEEKDSFCNQKFKKKKI